MFQSLPTRMSSLTNERNLLEGITVSVPADKDVISDWLLNVYDNKNMVSVPADKDVISDGRYLRYFELHGFQSLPTRMSSLTLTL